MNIIKIIWRWLISDRPSNLLTIVLALLASASSILVAQKQLNDYKIQLNQTLTNLNSQSQTQTIVTNQETLTNTKQENNIKGTVSFDPNDWELIGQITPDKEGYYCPYTIPFPGWFMWTKNKFESNKEMSITFQLLDKTNNNKNPTFYISYGDKTNSAPDPYYRFNILDGDLNTLRLYNRKSKEVLFERSTHDIQIDDFITFKIAPVFLKSSSSTLLLNPALSYQINGATQYFEPKKEFRISLPFPSQNDQGQGVQYGIGVSAGDCFKIISYEFGSTSK